MVERTILGPTSSDGFRSCFLTGTAADGDGRSAEVGPNSFLIGVRSLRSLVKALQGWRFSLWGEAATAGPFRAVA